MQCSDMPSISSDICTVLFCMCQNTPFSVTITELLTYNIFFMHWLLGNLDGGDFFSGLFSRLIWYDCAVI
jgi:hypothetical protein